MIKNKSKLLGIVINKCKSVNNLEETFQTGLFVVNVVPSHNTSSAASQVDDQTDTAGVFSAALPYTAEERASKGGLNSLRAPRTS